MNGLFSNKSNSNPKNKKGFGYDITGILLRTGSLFLVL